MEYIDRNQENKRRQKVQREQEHWEEVHNQLIEVQNKQRVQKKSQEISNPSDPDEKEADEVARKVSNGESTEIHGSGGAINRKGEGTTEITPEFQTKLESSKGGGQSLDDSTRSEMESKMSADFRDVKIHTDDRAHNMSEGINAKAFTHGKDVFFKQGEFNTETIQGKELLAHELVHTVQQGNEVQAKIQRTEFIDPYANYTNSFEVVFDGDTLIFTIARTMRKDDWYTTNINESTLPAGYSLKIKAKNGGDEAITDNVFFHGLTAPPVPVFISDGAIIFQTGGELINYMITDQVELNTENGITTKTHHFTTSKQSDVFPDNSSGILAVTVPVKQSSKAQGEAPYIPDVPGKSHEGVGDIANGLYVRFDSNGDQTKDMLMKMVLKTTVPQKKKKTDPEPEPRQSILFSLTSFDTAEVFEKELDPAIFKTYDVYGSFNTKHIQRSDGIIPNIWEVGGWFNKKTSEDIANKQYLYINAPVHENDKLVYDVDFVGLKFPALFDLEKTKVNKTITAGEPVFGAGKMAVDLKLGVFQDKLRLVLEPIPGVIGKSKMYLFMYINENQIAAPQTATAEKDKAVPVAPFTIDVGPPYSLSVMQIADKTDNVAIRLDFNNDATEDLVIYDRLIEDEDFLDQRHANNARQHWVHLKGDKLQPSDSIVMFLIQLSEMKRSKNEPSDEATFTQYMKFFLPGDFNEKTKPGTTDMFGELTMMIAQVTQFRKSLKDTLESDVPFTDKMDEAWNNYVISAYTLYPLKNAEPPQSDAAAESTYKTSVEAFYDAFKAEIKEVEKDESWWESSFSLDKPDKKLQKKLDTSSWKKINKELSYYAKRYAAWTDEVMEGVGDKAKERDEQKGSGIFIANYETQQANTAKGMSKKLKAITKIQNKPGLQHLRVMHYPKDYTFNNDKGENVRLTRVPLDIYYWKEDDEWHVKDITNPDDTYEREIDAEEGQTEPPKELFDLLNESGHFVDGYMYVELPSGAIYEVPTYMAHDASYYATYIALALAAIALMLTGIGEAAGVGILVGMGEIMMTTANIAFVVSGVLALQNLAAHDRLTFSNVLLEVGNIILGASSALLKGPGLILSTASKSEALLFGKMVPLVQASKVGYIVLFNVQKVGSAAIVLALEIEAIKQLAALDGKGSREDMIRAGQALLFQLLAAGMMRSLTLSSQEALLQAQGGKNLMLLEIEGRLCIAPANPALQNLLTNTVKGAQLSTRAMNGLLTMSEAEISALTGKTVAEIESVGLRTLWVKENAIILTPNYAVMDLPRAMNHIKYRDLTVPRDRGVGGAHDETEWMKVRKAFYTTGYKVDVGKKLADVEEVIVISDKAHPTVPGVRVVEYKIPAIDGKSYVSGKPAGNTTGALKGDGPIPFKKTIYDPAVWSDAKLQTALEEALQYSMNKNGGVIPIEFSGITKEGYTIHGFYRNGKVDTFFFE